MRVREFIDTFSYHYICNCLNFHQKRKMTAAKAKTSRAAGSNGKSKEKSKEKEQQANAPAVDVIQDQSREGGQSLGPDEIAALDSLDLDEDLDMMTERDAAKRCCHDAIVGCIEYNDSSWWRPKYLLTRKEWWPTHCANCNKKFVGRHSKDQDEKSKEFLVKPGPTGTVFVCPVAQIKNSTQCRWAICKLCRDELFPSTPPRSRVASARASGDDDEETHQPSSAKRAI